MTTTRLLLGIETSCDETAAAIARGQDQRVEILSSVVASQDELHAKYGGIVPEIAARRQQEVMLPCIIEALGRAGVTLGDIGAIAVTAGPGLVGSLVVGLATAKAIAVARGIPVLGLNHLEGHIHAGFLTKAPEFPVLCLIASGGHSHLVAVHGYGRYEILGRTRDDAPGEAFEKGGRLLGLPYPGGPALARLAEKGDRKAVKFPLARMPEWDFSFSGLKTALARHPLREDESRKADLAACYQEAIVEALVARALGAAEAFGFAQLYVVGGVARNERLREVFAQRAPKLGMRVTVPPPELCTDNAAMIVAAGYYKLVAGKLAPPDLDCAANLPLESWG